MKVRRVGKHFRSFVRSFVRKKDILLMHNWSL